MSFIVLDYFSKKKKKNEAAIPKLLDIDRPI